MMHRYANLILSLHHRPIEPATAWAVSWSFPKPRSCHEFVRLTTPEGEMPALIYLSRRPRKTVAEQAVLAVIAYSESPIHVIIQQHPQEANSFSGAVRDVPDANLNRRRRKEHTPSNQSE